MKIEMNSIVNSTIENPVNPLLLHVYPNPTSNILKFDIIGSLDTTYELTLFDFFGKSVLWETIFKNHNTLKLDLPGGTYFYQVKNKAQFIGYGKIILQLN